MRLSVFGATRRAVAYAAAYAHLGHETRLISADERVRAALRSASAPFHEPGLPTLLAEHVTSGRMQLGDVAQAAECRVHLVCADVGVAPGVDLGSLSTTMTMLIPRLGPDSLVIATGLAPAGTAMWLADWLAESCGAALVWLPDLARSGELVTHLLTRRELTYGLPPARPMPEAIDLLDQIHAPLLARDARRTLVPYQLAELVPLAAAGRRAVETTYVNLLSELADAVGVDVDLLVAAAGAEATPNLGYGADDARATALLQAATDRLGLEHRGDLVRSCQQLNTDRPWVAATLASAIGGERDLRRVALLGAGARPESDDLSDSPPLALADILTRTGKIVTVCDPAAAQCDVEALVPVRFVRDPYHAVDKADVVIVATPWGEYRALDPVRLASLVARRSILDAAGVLEAADWVEAGWNYRAFGR